MNAMRSNRATENDPAVSGAYTGAPDVSAIIPAAGLGKRFGSGARKQYMELGGRPLITWVLDAFEEHPRIRDIVIVLRQEDMDLCHRIISKGGYTKTATPVTGGAERQDSVYNGLQSLTHNPPAIVLVHDAVRPFLSQALITSCIEGIAGHDGAIAAVPPKDTIKQGGMDSSPAELTDPPVTVVDRTLDRSTLWSVQTPQAFPYETLLRAYEAAAAKDFYSTDDSALVEAMGGAVRIVRGYYENIKVTTPEDLAVADAIIRRGF